MLGLVEVESAHSGQDDLQLSVSTAVFPLVVGPSSKLVAGPLLSQLARIDSVEECIVLQSFGWVPAASCPSGDHTPLVAKDMVGGLLVVGACTCCCTLVVHEPVDFGRIDSSAR